MLPSHRPPPTPGRPLAPLHGTYMRQSPVSDQVPGMDAGHCEHQQVRENTHIFDAEKTQGEIVPTRHRTRRRPRLPEARSPDSPHCAGAGHSGQRQPKPPAQGEGPGVKAEEHSWERITRHGPRGRTPQSSGHPWAVLSSTPRKTHRRLPNLRPDRIFFFLARTFFQLV